MFRFACLMGLLTIAHLGGAAAQSIERYYCTQSGPLLIHHNNERAAGVLTRLDDASFVVFIGAIVDGAFAGEWRSLTESGAGEFIFSDDFSSFEGRLVSAAHDGETDAIDEATTDISSVEELRGFLPPAGDPASFRIDGTQYRCR